MSVMTAQNVVADVQPRVVKEGTPDQRTIYDVVDREGVKWTAWEKALAEKAWNLKNQASQWTVEITQNSRGTNTYTNRTLKNIEPITSNGMGEALGNSSFGHSGTITSGNTETTFTTSSLPDGATPTTKDISIWRQTATKVAAHLQPATETEFWQTVQTLIKFYETGVHPGPVDDQSQVPDDGIPF